MEAATNVVIVGASFAGISATHALLKEIPAAKITLINPSREFFFNIASPRILAKPTAIQEKDYLIDLPSLLEHYQESINFVQCKVASLDINQNTVILQDKTSISYNHLIIASGSTTLSSRGHDSDLAPWKADHYESMRQSIKASQSKIAKSKHIVIGGAGVVGVEFAGELGDILEQNCLLQDCEERQVTLVCAGDRPLPSLPAQLGLRAEKILTEKGVQLLKGRRIDSVSQDHVSGEWSVVLADGEIVHADCFISTAGVIPNTGFVPIDLLSSDGWVTVDENLRVVSNHTHDCHQRQLFRLFALGDVTIHKPRIVRPIADQAAVIAANIKADIEGIAVNDTCRPAYSSKPLTSILIPIGESTGIGLAFGFSLYGWLVWLIKGRNYLIPYVKGFLMRT